MAGAGSRNSVGNLPAQVTSFVGRRQEVAAAKRVLRRHRLLTLTGGPGVGKTRLALQVASQLEKAFAGGVWLVELAPLVDDKFLAQTVVDTLGIPDRSARPTMVVLKEFLEDKELLLVLDNCDHLVEPSATLVNDLLVVAPRLRVLATSRQALLSGGERLLEVPPLPVPGPDVPAPGRTPARNEAVRLFAERAALARPGFTVDARNRDLVARVCRRLEGIPLAIELTAVRVRALPLEQILTRLEQYYFDLLAEGSRTAMPQVRTLWAAISSSFDLCSEQERTLWLRASVFTGGFDLEAVEEVCSGAGIAREDVLDLVAGLVDKSVLVRTEDVAVSRFRMLEAVRQYGEQRLKSSGHRTAARLRHRDYYRRLAERAERDWVGPNEQAWYAWFRREHANLRTALECCLTEPGQAREGLAIAAALWVYWHTSGWLGEARYWLGSALELDREPSLTRVKALWVHAWLAFLQADRAVGLSMVEECRALAERLGDRNALAHATWISGIAAFFHDDIPRAVELYEEALPSLRATGDRRGVWITLLSLANALTFGGDADRALAFGKECLGLVEKCGGSMSRSWSLWVHGFGWWTARNHTEADRLIRECLRVLVNDHSMTAHCLEALAWIAAAEGDEERAARLLGVADRLFRSAGTPPSKLRHLASEHELCTRRVRQALGDQTFTALFDEGIQLATERAITYALSHARHEDPTASNPA